MRDLLKKLIGTSRKPPTAEGLAEAEQLLAAELRTARDELDALLARRDDEVLDALAAGDEPSMNVLRLRISDAERRVAELQAATAAAGARRAAAEYRRADQALRARWDAARALVAQRDEAGKRLEAALDAAASALGEIRALQESIAEALPVQPNQAPLVWGPAGLEHAVSVHLALRARPLFARATGLARSDELLTVAAAIADSGQQMLGADQTAHLAAPVAA